MVYTLQVTSNHHRSRAEVGAAVAAVTLYRGLQRRHASVQLGLTPAQAVDAAGPVPLSVAAVVDSEDLVAQLLLDSMMR